MWVWLQAYAACLSWEHLLQEALLHSPAPQPLPCPPTDTPIPSAGSACLLELHPEEFPPCGQEFPGKIMPHGPREPQTLR